MTHLNETHKESIMFTVSAKLQAQIDLMIEADHDYIPNPDGLGEEYSVYNFFDEGAFIVNTNGECDMGKATKLVRVAHSNASTQENKPQTKQEYNSRSHEYK